MSHMNHINRAPEVQDAAAKESQMDTYNVYSDEACTNFLFNAPLAILRRILDLQQAAVERVQREAEVQPFVRMHGNRRLYLNEFSIVIIVKAAR